MEVLQKQTIANVDLKNSRIELQEIVAEAGAICLGSYEIVWEKYKDMMADAVSKPDKNPFLAISTGPLTGTGVPGSAAYFISYVSPISGKFTTELCEGSIGPYLRYAGIEHLVLYGKAKKPVTLWINEKGINVFPAQEIKNLDNLATSEILHRQFGEDAIVACVGAYDKVAPSKFASVVCDYYHEVEALGLGQAFYNLGIKALVVNGKGAITIANPEEFLQELIEIYKYYKHSSQDYSKFSYITGDTFLSAKNENRFVEIGEQAFGIAKSNGRISNFSRDELLAMTQQSIRDGLSWRMLLDFIAENLDGGEFSYDPNNILQHMENWLPQNLYQTDISTVQATGLFWDEANLPFIDAIGRVAKLLRHYSGQEWNSFRLEEVGRQLTSIRNRLALEVK